MSRSINKVILVGNAGRDPDVITTASGAKVAHVSLATSRRVPREDGFEERTEWHRITLWDRLAQIAEDYIRKGDRLYVEGRIEYDSFEKNGVTIPTAEVRVRELVMLGGPNGRSASRDVAEPAEDAPAAKSGSKAGSRSGSRSGSKPGSKPGSKASAKAAKEG